MVTRNSSNQSDATHAVRIRWAIVLGLYTVILVICRWLAYEIKFEFRSAARLRERDACKLRLDYSFKLVLLCLFGQYAGLLSYFSIPI